MGWTLIAIAAALAGIRLSLIGNVEPEGLSLLGSYQAVAHVFVGFVLGFAGKTKDKLCLFLFWALVFVEIVSVILSRTL